MYLVAQINPIAKPFPNHISIKLVIFAYSSLRNRGPEAVPWMEE